MPTLNSPLANPTMNICVQNLFLFVQIGDVGAKRIAEFVTKNTSLQVLDLSNNQITDEGAQYFADALVENTGLVQLNLLNNDITEHGALQLALAGQQNTRCHIIRPGESNSNDMFQSVCTPS